MNVLNIVWVGDPDIIILAYGGVSCLLTSYLRVSNLYGNLM